MTHKREIHCLISSISETKWQIQVTLNGEPRYFYAVANFLQYMNTLDKQQASSKEEVENLFLWEREAGLLQEHFNEIAGQMQNASALIPK